MVFFGIELFESSILRCTRASFHTQHSVLLHTLPPLLLRLLMMVFVCLFFLHDLFLSLPSGLILFALVLVLMLGVFSKDLEPLSLSLLSQA